ncbi:MAG: DUF2190 family protein [Planctomycetales bacterium]|nr:DUF2190 family protein [Planctomycetales bacterium]
MTTQLRAPSQTFEATEVISKNLRVKLNAAGTVSIAVGADSDIGVTNGYAYAAGDDVGVDLASLEGTAIGVAAVAITTGDKIYGADGGKIGKTNTNAPIGIAMSDAAADGDKVEFVRRQI